MYVPMLCILSRRKNSLNYDRFVEMNILGAARLVHSDPQIYQFSFFLFDKKEHQNVRCYQRIMLSILPCLSNVDRNYDDKSRDFVGIT